MRKPCVDHLGNQFPTQKAMCEYWGVKQSSFCVRLGRGFSLSDALTTPPAAKATNCKPCVDHLGNEFPSVSAMCRHWGVGQNAFHNRLSRGLSLADALTTPLAGKATNCKPCVDHLGNEFPSVRAMCAHWGVSQSTFRFRLSKGVPFADALATPAVQKATPCVDHEGNEFPSQAAMCRHWGVSFDTYKNRRRMGWDLERALTEPVLTRGEDPSSS